jgi:exopolysaccharide production protein ExoQ
MGGMVGHSGKTMSGLIRCYMVLVIAILSGARLHLEPYNNVRLMHADPSNPMEWILLGILYIFIAVFFVRHPGIWWSRVKSAPAYFCLMGIVAVSFFWSFDPGLTFRRGFALFLTGQAGLYCAVQYKFDEMLPILADALAMVIAISICVALAMPDIGASPVITGELGWRGLLAEKNNFGRVCGIGMLVFIYLSHCRQVGGLKRGLYVGCALLALLGCIRSESKATLATLICIFVIAATHSAALRIFRSRRVALTAAALTGVVLTVFLASSSELVFSFFKRDSSLSGRTTIWSLAMDAWLHRPWIGHGYGAFWLNRQGPDIEVNAALAGFVAAHSHNGYLDVLLDIGIVGLAALILLLAGCFVRHLKAFLRHQSSREHGWALLFLLFMVIYNFFDSSLLRRNSLEWMLLTVICFYSGTLKQSQNQVSSSGVLARIP